MKKIEIIKSSREYTEIINKGQSKKSKYFSVYYRKNNTNNRYGITVPKKTGTAVIRNKIKRRMQICLLLFCAVNVSTNRSAMFAGSNLAKICRCVMN